MMAQRLPGILPPLSPAELLETSMVHSVKLFPCQSQPSNMRHVIL
jgi:predicted ATPase with chaperone activity